VKPDDERVSHCLVRVLRYNTDRYGLQPDLDGFVLVSELLSSCPEDFAGVDEEDLRRVTQTSVSSRGPRFELREAAESDVGGTEIRTLYKHPKDGYRHRGAWRRDRDPSTIWVQGRDHHGGSASSRSGPRQGFSRGPVSKEVDPLHEGIEALKPSAASSAREPQIALEQHAPSSASASTVDSSRIAQVDPAQAEESQPTQEVWERYYEPGTQRAWFWNVDTEEVFYADDPDSGWERFEDEEGNPWWWNDEFSRFFIEEPYM
jgi:hypothetical protein